MTPKNKNSWILGWAVAIFFILLFVFFVFGFVRLIGVEEGYDKYCKLKFGENAEKTDGSILTETIECRKIDWEGTKEADYYYLRSKRYIEECERPNFFDITNWKVKCEDLEEEKCYYYVETGEGYFYEYNEDGSFSSIVSQTDIESCATFLSKANLINPSTHVGDKLT